MWIVKINQIIKKEKAKKTVNVMQLFIEGHAIGIAYIMFVTVLNLIYTSISKSSTFLMQKKRVFVGLL